jgi:hypothetical protein
VAENLSGMTIITKRWRGKLQKNSCCCAKGKCDMNSAKAFGLSWRVSHLDSRPVSGQPISFQERLLSNENFHYTAASGLKNEHVLCASVRGCITRYSAETNAPVSDRFSRQRAASRCRWGKFSLYGYVLVQSSNELHKKALGIRVTTAVPGVAGQIGEGNPCEVFTL